MIGRGPRGLGQLVLNAEEAEKSEAEVGKAGVTGVDETRPAVRAPNVEDHPASLLASGFHAYQQGQFRPFPLAVHIAESNLAQPPKLRFHVEQLIRRVFLAGSHGEGREES